MTADLFHKFLCRDELVGMMMHAEYARHATRYQPQMWELSIPKMIK